MPHFSPPTPPPRARALAALALLAAAGAAQAQTPASFAPVMIYSTGIGSNPTGVTVTDVNVDGRLDIVTANFANGTAGVLLGRAGGGFAAVTSYSTGTNCQPNDVAVADMNGDKRLDIVTANFGNSTVGVLLGQAGGGFAPVSAYSADRPLGVAVADVNGDGRLDVVTANNSTNTAGVLLGQAGGGFATMIAYPSGPSGAPNGVDVADMNGDGRLDIIIVNITGTVGVLLGRVGGGFAAVTNYQTGLGFNSRPKAVAVADVNSDGRLDIVTANNASGAAGVLLGLAGGGFATASTYSVGVNSQPESVAVADLNGDGRLDIVTANYGTNMAGVLLGLAGGGFAPVSTYSNALPSGVTVADVNGDGRSDIVMTSQGSSVDVLLNTGTFTPLAAAAGTAAADVALFPNPARGGFEVRLPAGWGAVPVRAELLNALGQVVRQQATALPAGATLTFATDGLAAGVYLLRVQAGGYTLARRVVLD